MRRFMMFALMAACLLFQPSFSSASADDAISSEASANAPRLYSPFDEPQPRIPAEVLSDKRLDAKITVSVKNKNMKNVFSEISKRIGVKLVTSRELSGERPVIFLHDKSARDVMIEVSKLYGYHWLVKGKQDAWTYELFEGMAHSKRREQVRDSQETAQVDSLLDCVDICSRALDSDAELQKLQQTHPRLYNSTTEPLNNSILKVIRLMDRATLRSLVNDIGTTSDYSKLSPEMQAGVLNFLNAGMNSGGDPGPEPWTAERMGSARVQFKRWRASIFTPPHLIIIVSVPAKADGTGAAKFFEEWPDYDEGEPDLQTMAEAPPGRVIGDPLPKDIKITIKQSREQLYNGAILVGDVLAEIAKQGNLNVIADYYFQEASFPACKDEPLDKLVSEVCLKMEYTCQVEKDTLRFRFNKWYLQPLPEEPPLPMQEYWWRKITETGGLSLNDLIGIACLPGRQPFWGGFRLIPQAQQARLFPRTAKMVNMLGWTFENEACGPLGLHASRLNSKQFGLLTDWGEAIGIKDRPDDLLRSTVRIEKSGDPVNRLKFMLVLPDGVTREISMTARLDRLDEKACRVLAKEREAELVADRIELCLP
ncbi:MAG TPA: hypothetical protein VFI02_22005 [Armatimonadota bacterium]|nr:hypothetical protein [Armatimonadota bacterium]